MLKKIEIQCFDLKCVCHYFVVLFCCFLFVTQPVLRISYNWVNPCNAKQIIDFMVFSAGTIFAFSAWLTMWILCFIKVCFKFFGHNKNLKLKKIGIEKDFFSNDRTELLLDLSYPFLYSDKTETLRE